MNEFCKDHLEQSLPMKLGKFEIMNEIGRGNMAVVYLGHDPFMGRDVAIKVAHPHFIQDINTGSLYRKMFFNEARIAGMLDNKYIIPVYDAGIEDNFLYIVMEHVKNAKTLRQYCDPEDLLPISKVLEIIYKCCRALDYAHTRDVIHRDIKPSNILLTEDMDVRISDFGIAQIIRADATQFVGLMGSPLYMSPEQISEQPLTNQTDLYSLGALMYELLTGHPPFYAQTIPAIANLILNEEPPLMRSYRHDIPEALEPIIKRALAKRPEGRYSKGLDFAADILLAFKHQMHVATAQDTSRQEKFKRLKTNRFFRDFFDSEIMEVVDNGNWGEFAEGETIISEGDLDDSFYVIIQGSVNVRKGEVLLSSLEAGDCFGEMGFFSKTHRTASIMATTGVKLIKANSTMLEKSSLNCQIRFMRVFLHALIERLSKTSSLVSNTIQNK